MSDDHRSADEREFERFLTSLRRQDDRLRRVRPLPFLMAADGS